MYFKIYLNRDAKLTIVCLQDIDENDYQQHRFVRENGCELKFDKEDDAVKYLNDNFKIEYIDPFYLFSENLINSMRK